MNVNRSSGILLHLTSLPSKGGVGCVDSSAYKFVDILREIGVKYWQILPINYPLMGGCPYNCKSAYALNPLFIDLKEFYKNGLLSDADINEIENFDNSNIIDFGKVEQFKLNFLYTIFENYLILPPNNSINIEINKFKIHNAYWLDDFVLFEALKKHFNNVSWSEWDKDVRFRNAKALDFYKKILQKQIQFEIFVQYFLYYQLSTLKKYANANNVKIIGDIPIYVSYDSADVWAHPELFHLNNELLPKKVSGVPPDMFNENGQLWGNPIYNWNFQRRNNYKWWAKRLNYLQNFSDVIRIDHFIGFVKYYEIDAHASTAKEGVWQKGPGLDFFHAINKQLHEIELIAEDLGDKNNEVDNVLKQLNILGNRVLQFGLPVSVGNEHSPFNIERNVVYYTSTHDNNTLKGMLNNISAELKSYLYEYLDCSEDNIVEKMIRKTWESNALIAITTVQDILNLDENARMNIPGTIHGNWSWRLTDNELNIDNFSKIKNFNKLFCR